MFGFDLVKKSAIKKIKITQNDFNVPYFYSIQFSQPSFAQVLRFEENLSDLVAMFSNFWPHVSL